MSDLLAELTALTPAKPPTQCRTCRAILAEPELDAALRNADASGAGRPAIAAVLKRHGYDVSEDSLQSHFKNGHKPL